MKFCRHCGNQLMDAAVMCPRCGCMTDSAPMSTAQQAPATPMQQAYYQPQPAPVNYEEAINNATATNIISGLLLAVSAIVWYLFSIYGGAVIALAAEVIALLPNTKLQSMFKKTGLGSGHKEETKAITKNLKKKSVAFSISFVIAIIALIVMIFFLFTPELLF